MICTDFIICDNYVDVSNKRGSTKEIYNLIHGCDLQAYGIIDTETSSRMRPEESKLFLMDLLRARYGAFTLDQIPHISGLVCGVLSDTGHRIWATEDEFAEFGDKIIRL